MFLFCVAMLCYFVCYVLLCVCYVLLCFVMLLLCYVLGRDLERELEFPVFCYCFLCFSSCGEPYTALPFLNGSAGLEQMRQPYSFHPALSLTCRDFSVMMLHDTVDGK